MAAKRGSGLVRRAMRRTCCTMLLRQPCPIHNLPGGLYPEMWPEAPADGTAYRKPANYTGRLELGSFDPRSTILHCFMNA